MRSNPQLAICFACSILAACGPATLGGSFEIFVPGTPTFEEREPNDSASGPDYLTSMHAGDTILVNGTIDDGCCDPFDGFAIETEGALDLRFELTAHNSWSDLDLCVYDPQSDVFLACFESLDNPESGWVSIALPAEVQVIVRAWSGASDYTLRIEAHELPFWYYSSPAPADPASGWVDYSARELPQLRLREEAHDGSGKSIVRADLVRNEGPSADADQR